MYSTRDQTWLKEDTVGNTAEFELKTSGLRFNVGMQNRRHFGNDDADNHVSRHVPFPDSCTRQLACHCRVISVQSWARPGGTSAWWDGYINEVVVCEAWWGMSACGRSNNKNEDSHRGSTHFGLSEWRGENKLLWTDGFVFMHQCLKVCFVCYSFGKLTFSSVPDWSFLWLHSWICLVFFMWKRS